MMSSIDIQLVTVLNDGSKLNAIKLSIILDSAFNSQIITSFELSFLFIFPLLIMDRVL